MAKVAHVLYCVSLDETTQECTQTAWLPAPSFLPPLSSAEVVQLFIAAAVVLATAWGVKIISRSILD